MIEFFTFLFVGGFVVALMLMGFFAMILVAGVLALPFVWLYEVLRNTQKS